MGHKEEGEGGRVSETMEDISASKLGEDHAKPQRNSAAGTPGFR